MLAQKELSSNYDNDGKIEQFVMQVPTVSPDINGQSVKDIFEENADIEGIVVLENGHTVGIIMRTDFFQKIGSMYGHSLYMKRPIHILMETAIMTVDVNDCISKISLQAMNREQHKLYDYIIVNKNMSYYGVINIRLFLVELAKRNEAQINVLQHQKKELISAHEKEVSLIKNLEMKSASEKNLLDNADQGFLWFTNDMVIKNEYSYKCLEIFNISIGGQNYIDLLSGYFNVEKLSLFRDVFESYFTNNSPITDNVYLMLLPSDCLISDRNIHFEYRSIENNGQKAVMAILNDITEKINMEKALEEDRNKNRLLIKAISCQTQIKQMYDEFNDLFSGGYNDFFSYHQNDYKTGLNELFRTIHTFKGDFAQYGLISSSEQLHIFEDKMSHLINNNSEVCLADVEKIMCELDTQKILEKDLNIIYSFLGESYFEQNEIISIPKDKIEELENKINNNNEPLDKTIILDLIRSLKLKNIKIYLNQYQDYLQYLSDRLLKSMPVYIVEGADIEIDREHYKKFFKVLVHIFRNIMDHGIETDEERLVCGKPERGSIFCQINHVDDRYFSLSISDDGRGINLYKLKEKALNNKLFSPDELESMSDQEIANLIFLDNMSTKDSATGISGRGMGMPAFKSACLALDGNIEITTQEGQGTTFLITLPYKQ